MRRLIFAGESAAAGQAVEGGIGVAPGHEYTFAQYVLFIGPFHGDAVGGVFAGKAEEGRQPGGAHLLEADEADADDGVAAVKLGPEGGRQEPLDDFGAGPEVDEQSAFDDACDDGDAHERH